MFWPLPWNTFTDCCGAALCVGSVLVKSLFKCFSQWSDYGEKSLSQELQSLSFLSNMKNHKEKHKETNKLISGSCLQSFHRAVALDSHLLLYLVLCIAKI